MSDSPPTTSVRLSPDVVKHLEEMRSRSGYLNDLVLQRVTHAESALAHLESRGWSRGVIAKLTDVIAHADIRFSVPLGRALSGAIGRAEDALGCPASEIEERRFQLESDPTVAHALWVVGIERELNPTLWNTLRAPGADDVLEILRASEFSISPPTRSGYTKISAPGADKHGAIRERDNSVSFALASEEVKQRARSLGDFSFIDRSPDGRAHVGRFRTGWPQAKHLPTALVARVIARVLTAEPAEADVETMNQAGYLSAIADEVARYAGGRKVSGRAHYRGILVRPGLRLYVEAYTRGPQGAAHSDRMRVQLTPSKSPAPPISDEAGERLQARAPAAATFRNMRRPDNGGKVSSFTWPGPEVGPGGEINYVGEIETARACTDLLLAEVGLPVVSWSRRKA